ncbi:MAG: hypothetical protein JXR69_07295 [Candidatus Delongbacteria bacterium]|nr:hypothetical protein [Candidatus Delongbacteria bacterium]
MKKIKLVLLVCLLFVASMVNADTYGKQNSFGLNPFGLLFNIYSGEYGRFMDAAGTTEINVPFYFFSYEDFTALGLGAKYRMYKDGNGEGVFYGGGLTIDSWTWEDIYWYDSVSMTWKTEDTTWLTITPLGELGYRWSWPNGWTIAPSLELGFAVSTFDGNDDWGDLDYGAQGLHWGLNLGVAYMF